MLPYSRRKLRGSDDWSFSAGFISLVTIRTQSEPNCGAGSQRP